MSLRDLAVSKDTPGNKELFSAATTVTAKRSPTSILLSDDVKEQLRSYVTADLNLRQIIEGIILTVLDDPEMTKTALERGKTLKKR